MVYGSWLMRRMRRACTGNKRRGLIEAMGLSGQIEVQMGTLEQERSAPVVAIFVEAGDLD